MWREYQFRSKFSITHEQYLDEPIHVIEWMIALDNLNSELTNG